MENNVYLKNIFYVLTFLGVIILGVLLKILSSFFIPVAVAILLSGVFYPIVKKLNHRLKIPWILGSAIMALAVIVVFGILSTVIGTSFTAFFNQYNKYETKFLTIYRIFTETFHLPFDDSKSFFENMWEHLRVRDFVQKMAFSLSGGLVTLVRNLGVILLFMFFLLLEMRFGNEKVNSLFKGKNNGRVMKITRKIISETVSFLSIKFFISLATGFFVFLCCFILKIDFSILWAFCAFVMNFIPIFGSIFSVGLTTLFALLQYYPSQPLRIFLVLVIMSSVNFVLGNIVEPRVEGKRLGLSPFVILVSLTFWNWIWGFVGMIIAVPLMAVIKIICENISFLRPIAILLGNSNVKSAAVSESKLL
ncbi:MAG: AI-2E family transporter [Treponema sp.]|nr:AI-2E family transporter [Treponema sp.]MDE6245553.1 AI-2E family transporter [Treponemataceae bacterium]MBD5409332.1 AI-2E family transporter [Treponema sp.]MBD5410863.1 AI-2E family transporter [Treponema sp.]MBD5411931.1 AI-2E family transporter [Treponema sp.]